MNHLIRPAWMLAALVSLPACNKPPAAEQKVAAAPAPVAVTPTVTPTAPVVVTRSITITSVFIDPKIATLCAMAQPKAFFDFDSAVIEPSADRSLALLAECAKTGPLKDRKLDLIGHTDPRGTDEYNAKLGRSRAQAVADALVKEGMVESTMKVESQGEKGADPESPEEWTYDRRVDIRLAE